MTTERDRDHRDDLPDVAAGGRRVTAEQMEKFAGYVAEIFSAFGIDLDTPATRDTPKRFLKAMADITDGYEGDPKLITVFDTECRGGPDCRLSQVVEGPIRFFSLCEHHALPFYGHAYVGYIAHEQIIGISKLTRTTFWRGNYENDPQLRSEFFVACGLHRFEPGAR